MSTDASVYTHTVYYCRCIRGLDLDRTTFMYYDKEQRYTDSDTPHFPGQLGLAG